MILITSISIGDGVIYAISFLYLPHDVLFGPTYGSYDLFMIANFDGQPGLTLRAGFVESPSRSADDTHS
jgi:hypothetical protein